MRKKKKRNSQTQEWIRATLVFFIRDTLSVKEKKERMLFDDRHGCVRFRRIDRGRTQARGYEEKNKIR